MLDYTSIDYRTWVLGNEARKGVNIKKLGVLREKEIELLEYFIPYQDQRDDPGHGEITALLGIKLLDFIKGGVREVIVPSALAHDTGWYGNDPNVWKKLVEANRDNLKSLDTEINRRPHQNRSIMIMGRAFQNVGYPSEKYHFECADIVGDHDTRKLPTTESGKIVRAADLLWRVTYPHAQIYMAEESAEEILKRAEETCLLGEKAHLGSIGVEIGRLEFANMIHFKFGKDTAAKVLKGNYQKELEKISSFYQ